MCTLIYATVPTTTDLSRLPPGTVRLVPAVSQRVSAKLAPGEQLCRVEGIPECAAGGHCGTVLGRAADRPEPRERLDVQAEKLKRKGWSEHKVQSWLAQKRETKPAAPPNMNGTVDELALWQGLLEAALVQTGLPYVGLMVFWASDERDVPLRIADVTRAQCDLTRLEQGVLYRIHRSPARARPAP